MSVTFFPPLFEQRQMWVLDILRKEKVKAVRILLSKDHRVLLIVIIICASATQYGLHQVLDVGCGEGSLLTALCNPAPWLPTPDQDSTERFKILRVSHLHGIDISDDDLQNTVISTSPPPEPTSEYAYYSRATRWEPLRVHIWKGSLASVNEPFIGMESIVSTEVYESLSHFARIILTLTLGSNTSTMKNFPSSLRSCLGFTTPACFS